NIVYRIISFGFRPLHEGFPPANFFDFLRRHTIPGNVLDSVRRPDESLDSHVKLYEAATCLPPTAIASILPQLDRIARRLPPAQRVLQRQPGGVLFGAGDGLGDEVHAVDAVGDVGIEALGAID